MATDSTLTIQAAHNLRFPPFPPVPDGVTLIPFHSFKPSGILVPIDEDDDVDPRELGDGVERDGLGIPTIVLRVKHAGDSLEKKKKRKKKGVGAQQVQVAERPKTWWEVWEETEDIRRNAYDANLPPADRLYQAGVDFKNGRSWPTAAQGVQHVWDIVRIYIGLLQQNPAPPKNATPDATTDATADLDAGSDTDSDTDDALADGKDEGNQLEAFLSDPEMSMKIFFSSTFRERGLIWSEPRCLATPILVSFFLRYLIRSRVFPEPEYDRPLRRALEIVELARVELPNSWKMGRALPDAFSDGCKGLWGTMQTTWVSPADDASLSSTGEPGAKRQKIDDSADAESQTAEQKPSASVDTDAAESTPAFVGGGEWGTAPGGEELEGGLEGWGTNASSWDGTAGSAPAEAEAEEGREPVHELAPIWDASAFDIQATWGLEAITLLPLLGPTPLPLTHTTGVVEQSTRRIVRVDPPRLPRQLAQNAPAVEAVEEDLACRFARLVLAPWERLDSRTYEAGSDVLPPSVLSTSRGAVVMEEEETETEDSKSAVVILVKAHRPWMDEIVVLVDPKLTDILIVGMGIGATWVEIVRDKEAGGGSAAPKKKGKGKKKEVPKYWYMEQVVHQLPSFYVDKSVAEED